MSNYVLKNLHRVRAAATITRKPLNESSFTVNYLINSCGFTTESALSASKYVKFEAPDKPDSVLRFFKNQGFSETQISTLVRRLPPVLLSNPENTLSPKLEFLKSKGISGSDLAVIISRSPTILCRSLDNQLIPSFNLFSNLLQSDERTIDVFKHHPVIFLCDLKKYVAANIEMLKQAGVPIRNIVFLFRYKPRSILTTCDKLSQVIEKVKKMGFNPSTTHFVLAVHTLRQMKKSTWDRKVEVYKKWGWSENDIVVAFRRYPLCMALSEVKLNLFMEFWVNKMGWKSSYLASSPELISLSLKKRIVPRCEVYKALVSKGLRKPGRTSYTNLLKPPEKRFLEEFINHYKEEAPELLKLYEEKLDLAK